MHTVGRCVAYFGDVRNLRMAATMSETIRRFRTGNEIDREEQGSLKEVVVQGDEGRDEVRRVPVVRGIIRYPKEDGTFYELR